MTTRSQGMTPRFAEIEGLRAWLAWAVLATHIFVVINVQDFKAGIWAPAIGGFAVDIFIMISGFVIAGLVIDRQEKWPPFILRRTFRIFPVYFVALAFGALTTPLAVEGLSRSVWASDPSSWYYGSMVGGLASTDSQPWAHWLLHLTLMQGAVPDSLLPWSAIAFVGPAWSLSLEWQFYLVAPALVRLMRSMKWAPWLVLFAFVSAFLFQRNVFGVYETHTSLLGGLWLFLIGIGSRIAFPKLKTLSLPLSVIVLGALGVALFARALTPVALWVAFLALLCRPKPEHIIDGFISRTADVLLTSRLATALGARSYSVYIIHIPIMKLLLFLLPLQAMSQMQALAWLAPLSVGLTLIVSEVLFRFVERPMIRLGARLAARELPSREERGSTHSRPVVAGSLPSGDDSHTVPRSTYFPKAGR